MAKKNQWLIEQYKELERQKAELRKATVNNVPEIYACFAKALIDDYNYTADEVEALFIRTQELWAEMVENDNVNGMIDWCEQATGVCLRCSE